MPAIHGFDGSETITSVLRPREHQMQATVADYQARAGIGKSSMILGCEKT